MVISSREILFELQMGIAYWLISWRLIHECPDYDELAKFSPFTYAHICAGS
jgi:hypothetical protein